MNAQPITVLILKTAVVRFEIAIRSSWRRRPSSLQRYTLTDTISSHDRNL